jgi:hypothetical protein
MKDLEIQKLSIQSLDDIKSFENIALCDNYLIINDVDIILLYEIDLNTNSANFLTKIKTEQMLNKIMCIDQNNIFFFFSASIKKLDISKKEVLPVQIYKIVNEEKMYVNSSDVTSIYFCEKIKLNYEEKIYYFGLIGIGSEGDLMVSKEVYDDRDSGHIVIICDKVRTFHKDLKHVEIKLFYPKESDVSKGYLFIAVLATVIGWYTLIKMPDFNDYISLIDDIQKTEWSVFYDLSSELTKNIFYSFYYDTNYSYPISFILLTDSLKLKFFEFDEVYTEGKNFIKSEKEIDFETEIKTSGNEGKGLKKDNLVGTHHYGDYVYVFFKNRIFLYDIGKNEIITSKKFEAELIRDIYVHYPPVTNDKKSFYHLYFLTYRHVYFSKIDTNYQSDQYRGTIHSFHVNDSKAEEIEDKKVIY